MAVGEGVQAVYQPAMGEAGSDQAQQQQSDGGLQYITNNGAQVRTVGGRQDCCQASYLSHELLQGTFWTATEQKSQHF